MGDCRLISIIIISISSCIQEIPLGMSQGYWDKDLKVLIAYAYDLNGNKISKRDVTGKTTKYCYNLLDELTEIIDNENKLARYTYHPDGSLASFKQLNGLETLYRYDADHDLTDLEVSLAGKKVIQNSHTYDKNGYKFYLHHKA